MTDYNIALSIVVIYHLVAAFFGLVAIYLGFRLFRLGLFSPAGDIDLSGGSGNARVQVKRAAPGTVFSLFGMLVILVSLSKGVTLQQGGNDPSKLGTVTVSGMEGQVPARMPTNIAIRYALSNYALCELQAADELTKDGCRQTLTSKDLAALPLPVDMKAIEDLESVPTMKRDANWKQSIQALRHKFLPLAYGEEP